MKLYTDSKTYIDTNEPLDISLELSNTPRNVRAWYVDLPKITPVKENGFNGSVASGGPVNFNNIFFNPHGHGTHTECLGHITEEVYSVNDSLRSYFFDALVITITPEQKIIQQGAFDYVITSDSIKEALAGHLCEALIIRTHPNGNDKKSKNYSATNPPYMDVAAIEHLNTAGVKHLLIDLPSVDREEDNGELVFHHAFWEVPENPQFDKTITELIYVDDTIEDGRYVLSIQMASFRNDAAPSRPVLYKQKKD